ncbi:MAG: hypothetical protein OEV53_10200 [Nitrospira sp.]|nr:hypothetical protein [Nitrospira sp.]
MRRNLPTDVLTDRTLIFAKFFTRHKLLVSSWVRAGSHTDRRAMCGLSEGNACDTNPFFRPERRGRIS